MLLPLPARDGQQKSMWLAIPAVEGLSISLNDNIFLGYDDRCCTTAPATEGGKLGSPVFDNPVESEWSAACWWQGSAASGWPAGTYDANEGIRIEGLSRRCARHGSTADGVLRPLPSSKRSFRLPGPTVLHLSGPRAPRGSGAGWPRWSRLQISRTWARASFKASSPFDDPGRGLRARVGGVSSSLPCGGVSPFDGIGDDGRISGARIRGLPDLHQGDDVIPG